MAGIVYGTEHLALRDPTIIKRDTRRWRAQQAIERYAKKQLSFTGKFKHGLTKEELFDLQFKYQKNKCAFCKKTPPAGLVLDHDHTTGKVRGFLCSGCNTHLVSVHTRKTAELLRAYLNCPPHSTWHRLRNLPNAAYKHI